ncbi:MULTISPECIES: hypothetical protein [Candidatus Ichthyocystis]|uniref:Uncharacterized protein n=1 Tax=Candidatus Ichthyocystis hellenicum TaxID=1561003 RepID=A0A0S4M2A6_9BURK|nr:MULTISPECIES: hypothetical protein [Ichthyocystis]CUT17822.1 hypothetical protein Ark11_1003 [Candidatus Ichthyocystis hellenicum]
MYPYFSGEISAVDPLHSKHQDNGKDTSSSMNELLEDLFPDLVGVSTHVSVNTESASRSSKKSFIESESLTKLSSSKSIDTKKSADTGYLVETSPMPFSLKRPFVEYEPLTTISSSKRVDTKKSADATYLVEASPVSCLSKQSSIEYIPVITISGAEKIDNKKMENTESASGKKILEAQQMFFLTYNMEAPNNSKKFVAPDELALPLSVCYSIQANIWNNKKIESIYDSAIKTIDIDNEFMLKKRILEEVGILIKKKGLDESCINISCTYSNIREYILGKISPYINNIIQVADVHMESGMSIQDVKSICISNKTFFHKLGESCKEVVEMVNKIHHEEFLPLVQTKIFFGVDKFIMLRDKETKTRISQALKLLVIATICNLQEKIVCAIKEFKEIDVLNGMFFMLHGIHISKSFMRNIMGICSIVDKEMSKKELLRESFDDYKELFDSLLIKLEHEVKTSIVFYEGKSITLNSSTVKLMTRYLLEDITYIYNNLYKKIKTLRIDSREYADSSRSWGLDIISSDKLYKLSLSKIKIDMGVFKNKINVIRFYVSELLNCFFSEIGEKDTISVKIRNGMSVENFRSAYLNNKEFFSKFDEFISKVNTMLANKEYSAVHKLIDKSKMALLLEKSGHAYNIDVLIADLITKNISNIPQKIADEIKLLPESQILVEFFSVFHNICIDNASLLKAKATFDSIKKKIINDTVLCNSMEAICNSIRTYDENIGNRRDHHYCTIVNTHIVDGGLSVSKYLRKLVKDQIDELKETLSKSIMTVSNGKVATANKKDEKKILNLLRSDMGAQSLKLYKNLCVEKSGIKNKSLPQLP